MGGFGAPFAVAAGVVVAVAGVLLGVFFVTGKETWGHANDAASAAFAALLVPVAFAVYERYGPENRWWVGSVAAVGLVGMVEFAIVSTVTAAGRLSFKQLAVWQGGGFGILLLWVAGVGALILQYGGMPAGLGWVGIATAVLVTIASLGGVRLIMRSGGFEQAFDVGQFPVTLTTLLLAGFVALPAWCIWLGLSLRS